MDIDTHIELAIKSGISSGELPSTIFRRMLVTYPNFDKYDLGSLFHGAFPNVDGVVWNIVAHWRPATESEPLDMRMDISLIHELQEANYQTVWDRAWLDNQWARVKNDVA